MNGKRFLNKKASPEVSLVIPAYNESKSLGNLIANCKDFCDEVIVVDDGSTDNTSEIGRKNGAVVIRNERNLGITKAIQRGLKAAQGTIVVTMDADGQHDPLDIPRLVEPLKEEKGEVALGVREEIPHQSERMINLLTNLRVKCSDVGTGFRAMKAEIANKIELHGECLCGTFVLETRRLGATIVEIPIQTKPRIYGERKIRTKHIRQLFYVLRDLVLRHK